MSLATAFNRDIETTDGTVSVPVSPEINLGQGADDTPFHGYFDTQHQLSFIWNGGSDTINVSHGGYAEPVNFVIRASPTFPPMLTFPASINDFLEQVLLVWHPYQADADGGLALILFDTGDTAHGRARLGYQLWHRRQLIFAGEDLHVTLFTAIDSPEFTREAAEAAMTFLTMREEDTDAEYFAGYTTEQLTWRDTFAEKVGNLARDYFGEGGWRQDTIDPFVEDDL